MGIKGIGGYNMAKDDYYVIAYRILAYLYACLKEENPLISNISNMILKQLI